ncbi:LysR family transcriptional regulator [Streptococcus gallolyticus]|uniref:LysR family transcriptional regulator n=1 Tax=Streptococcus gallolyticus TaxID=315405 RepID=UPI00088FB82D|nr:LysR family transcriptional regulator [Streptococcus gallolyticus]SDJ94571.1 DNA-binding transcriptional regulator, LysR family [Streptococcus gallolyticus]SDL44428.1 DNA-binding transcriptional regulator, LysR family [Streptococcus gallolyticus]
MNFQKFQVFLSLCETLNYTETAEQLYTTQGSISKQIIALEKELGVILFNRKHRQISLTEEGEIVRVYVQKIMGTFQEMQETLEDLCEQEKHKLTIHGIPSMSSYPIISDIAAFQKHYPDYTVVVEEEETDQLMHSLDDGICDVVFTRSFTEVSPDIYDSLTLDYDRFVLVLPENHPLANKEKLDLVELKDETFFQLGNKTQLLQKVRELCHAYGFEPKMGYQGNRINLIIDFIEKEMGVSVMMEKLVAPFKTKAIICRPLEVDMVSEMNLIRRKKKTTPALDVFWKGMQEKYSKQE